MNILIKQRIYTPDVQIGQGGEDGLVWSGLCYKDSHSQYDFDSEYIGFDGSPNYQHGIYAIMYVRNVRCHACGQTDGKWKVDGWI